jgi:cystinosin
VRRWETFTRAQKLYAELNFFQLLDYGVVWSSDTRSILHGVINSKMQEGERIALIKALSRLMGWTYFLCWSASFYPQPYMNWRRKSTHGLAIDYPTANVLGFVAYTISTAAFLFSPTIRSQYAYRHPASPEPTVRFNDFMFAAHGAVLCILTYSQFWPQIWGFQVGAKQRTSPFVRGVFWGSIVGVITTAVVVRLKGIERGNDPQGWAWIEVVSKIACVHHHMDFADPLKVYAISYIKLIVTAIKYFPQVIVNYRRKSTVGWSIEQILLDFSGGILSIGQLFIDASLQADWSGVTGNPVKFGLGNVSILFDIIFMTQHYVLYRHPAKTFEDEERRGEEQGLLEGESRNYRGIWNTTS